MNLFFATGGILLIEKPEASPKKFLQDKDRIQESILYLMGLGRNLSQYDILKSLFLADKSHLNKFGRPVTFDNYVAMENGPVGSLAYDALKPTTNYKSLFGEPRPWTSIPDADNPRINRYTALRSAKEEFLSKSDLASLRAAYGTVANSTFDQLKKLTHEDEAYKEAWARRGRLKASEMRLSLLIERGGEKREEDLVYMSL